eukprot:NODE_625_length_2037_cov_34.086519_g577_i0.p1 GENE.NODE_625_length_2037_cov_34.086519_g577_i0~~NODE_625_length_2037_cov_34.086519_g577_i0.p1  ORF type:complete len:641 (+),score=158.07 NODE_625_length_2037_cov_34.086519_g577_i0:147-1925(+)
MRSPIGQHRVIGSMRIRTLRTKVDSCSVNEHLLVQPASLQRYCFDAFDEDKEYRAPLFASIPYRTCDEAGGVSLSGERARYPCGGFTLDIPFNNTFADVMRVAHGLRELQFVDNSVTRLVILEYFTYIPPLDAFASVKIFNEVTSGGTWYNDHQLRLFTVWTPDNTPQTIYDCFFYVFVLYYCFWFIHEFRRESRLFAKRPLRYFLKVWNIVELVNMLCFIIVGFIKLFWIVESRNMHLDFTSDEYPTDLEAMLYYYSMSVYINSINTLLTFLKLLKFLQMNDNFNLLTRTLNRCKSGIIGVLAVFVFIITAFALCGTTLFGAGLRDFLNLNWTFSSLLRMMVGDFDYDALREENRFIAGVFFSSYIVLGLFLYMNFLIAVISDAFTDVKQENTVQRIEEQVQRTLKDVAFSVRAATVLQRLQIIQQRKTVSKLLRSVLDDVLVPFRNKMLAKMRWRRIARHVFSRMKRRLTLTMIATEASSLDAHVDKVTLTYLQLQAMIPRHTFTLLGDVYLRNTWDELIWEHGVLNDRPEELQAREEIDRMQYCTATATQPVLDDLRAAQAEIISLLAAAADIRGIASSGMSKKQRGGR